MNLEGGIAGVDRNGGESKSRRVYRLLDSYEYLLSSSLLVILVPRELKYVGTYGAIIDERTIHYTDLRNFSSKMRRSSKLDWSKCFFRTPGNSFMRTGIGMPTFFLLSGSERTYDHHHNRTRISRFDHS